MAKGDTATPDLSALLGVSVTMEDVDSDSVNQIRSSRGRQEGQDIQALRAILQDSLSTGKAKVFKDIHDDTVKETLVRKVRQAGKGAGEGGEDIKIATSYDRNSGNLFWGPKVVIDRLMGKSAA